MINREYYLNQLISCRENGFVKILIGVRRSGKSTLLNLYENYLLENHVSKDRIIKINFESMLFEELRDPMMLHEYIDNRIMDSNRYFLFIDEVQEIYEWSKVINSLRVTFNVDIYVTGSNSKVFSGEYLTYLSGRYISINVYPLSFSEFNIFTESKYNDYESYEKFKESSFPAIVLENNNMVKKLINNDLYHSIFERDIIQRGKIKNEVSFLKVAKFIYENIGNNISIKSIADNLKSQGHKISVEAIDNYLNLMCKAFCLYQCQRYDIKGKEILKTNGKYYTIDFGIRRNLVPDANSNTGRVLENFVYLELLKAGYDIYVGKIGRDYEIDFIAIKDDKRMYVQVSESILDETTRNREVRPFACLKDKYPKYLVTLDQLKFEFDECVHINVFDFIKKL